MPWNGKQYKTGIGVCKDCAERAIGCHGTCEKYIAAKKEWDAEKTKIFEERCKSLDYDTFRFETVVKRRATRERKAKKRHR